MERKSIIIVIIFVLILSIILLKKNKDNNEIKSGESNSQLGETKEYEWLEDEQRYVVYDKNGNIRGYADDEYGLKIFEDNPDFNLDSVPIGYYDQKEIVEYDE